MSSRGLSSIEADAYPNLLLFLLSSLLESHDLMPLLGKERVLMLQSYLKLFCCKLEFIAID